MKKHAVLKIAVLAGLLSFSSVGWAGCTSQFVGYSRTLNVPTIIVPRDLPYGSPLGSYFSVPDGVVVSFNCTTKPMALFKFGTALTLSSYSDIYKTNVEGIGIRVWVGPTVIDNNIKYGYNSPVAVGNAFMTGVRVQYYLIGPVTAGQTVTPNLTVQAWLNTGAVSTSGGAMYNMLTLTGSSVVAVSACETPNITVDLKKQDGTDLRTIGATTPETPFEFRMNNCGPGLSAVSYTFRPGPGITLAGSGAQQHLTLSNSSTGSGVGVQMLYRDGPNDGQPVPFNTKTQFTGYSTTAGGDYNIPMKARYIRTGQIVAGTANSSVEFTMAYE